MCSILVPTWYTCRVCLPSECCYLLVSNLPFQNLYSVNHHHRISHTIQTCFMAVLMTSAKQWWITLACHGEDMKKSWSWEVPGYESWNLGFIEREASNVGLQGGIFPPRNKDFIGTARNVSCTISLPTYHRTTCAHLYTLNIISIQVE